MAMQSFISGQPSVQGEEGDGLPNQTQDLVEFGWNMIKVNTVPNASAAMQGEVGQAAAAVGQQQLDGSPPSTRNCHSSTQFGQFLIVFGGREGDGKKRIVNDIFIFDTERQLWFQPKVDKNKLPQPRMGHSSQLWNGSQIIIYGGWNGFQVLSDVIFIDLKKGVEKLSFNIPSIIRGEAPMRQFHTASVIENMMFVFGGGDGKYWLNDLLIFDLTTLEWSGPVATQGIAPVGRLQHSAITFEKKIYIFGGEPDQYRQLNDIFYLDTSTLTWVKPQVTGQDPSARVSTTGCLVDSKIYYFGGYDGTHWMNDVHVFDIEQNHWEKVQTTDYRPRPRCRHTANIVKGQLYVFGGNDCELSFNDIWMLYIGVQVPQAHLQRDMLNLLETGEFSDVTFIINETRIKGHKCILASRSSFFKNMFTVGMRESEESIISVQDINLPTFMKLLEFIYSDQLNDLESAEQAIDVLVAANKYGLDRLKRLCEKFLVQLIDLENVIELLYLSDMHQAMELKRMCINFTMQYFDIVTKREDFRKLSKSILLELLQNK